MVNACNNCLYHLPKQRGELVYDNRLACILLYLTALSTFCILILDCLDELYIYFQHLFRRQICITDY